MKKINFNKFAFVKNILALTSTALIVGIFSLPTIAQQTSEPGAPGPLRIQDGKLLDSYGKPLILRGVTVEQNLAPEKVLQAIRDAAVLGANAVQVEINGNAYAQDRMITGAQLREIIETCKASKVICVLEPNDVAGYPEAPGAGVPGSTAFFWTLWPDIRAAVQGQEAYIILGFGNQYLGSMSPSEYITRMHTYLADFSRSLVGSFIIMIDGSNWGQDWDNAMYEFAKNPPNEPFISSRLLYSVDMFSAYTTPEKVRTYIESFSAIKAPLVIGGFAPTAYYHPHDNRPRVAMEYDLPEDSVMQYAEQYGVGYFGWSWSGNTNSALDVVTNYNPGALTNWGNLLFNGANGIKATAKTASIYDHVTSSSSSSSSSSSEPNRPPRGYYTIESEDVCSANPAYIRMILKLTTLSDQEGDPVSFLWSRSNSAETSSSPIWIFPVETAGGMSVTLTVTDSWGASTQNSKSIGISGPNCSTSSSSSSRSSNSPSSSPNQSSTSTRPTSSSSWNSSSRLISSSRSSANSSSKFNSSLRYSSTSSKSSSPQTSSSNSSMPFIQGKCTYHIQSEWRDGFTATIRLKNMSSLPMNGWDVKWQYPDSSKVTSLWNATLSGTNPYSAKNLGWNATIQPGQTVEFGFQGKKPAGPAVTPAFIGTVCLPTIVQ